MYNIYNLIISLIDVISILKYLNIWLHNFQFLTLPVYFRRHICVVKCTIEASIILCIGCFQIGN